MDKDAIKEALIEAIKDSAIQELIKEQVRAAVTEANAAKDEEIRELREDLEEAKAELEETKVKLNELEQYSRRLCLNVTGVPERPDEDTNQLVRDLAKMAGVNISPGDIDASHRVGAPKQGKARTVIVRFTHFPARQALYNARRELRKPRPFHGSTVSAETANQVFVSDNLTRENQLVLYKARQLKKDGKIFAAWSDVGKVKIRASQGGPTHVIRSVADLMKFAEPESQKAGSSAAAKASGASRKSARIEEKEKKKGQ